MTASRLQRWALILSAYDFDIEYVQSDKNNADALSRMILAHKGRKEEDDDCQENPEQTYLHFASEALLLDYQTLKRETARDPLLARVLGYIRDGWSDETEIRELKPFFNRKNELYEELGCVMWGHRVVIPSACTNKVLTELHDSHMGIVKTKQLARSYVWWPGIDEAVEGQCRACETCARHAAAPPAHSPVCWPWPDRAWTRLHVDFLGPLEGKTYLVTVDAHSKWIEIAQVSSTSAKCVLTELRRMWARFGIPKQVVSDNGPPFSSEEFDTFLKNNGVEHIFSAPYHPASNGAAENAVKTCKNVIKKALSQSLDIDTCLNRFLLIYRNTEHCTTGESPAKLLQGRSLRTRLDCLKPQPGARVQRAQQRQERAAGGSHRQLRVGIPVWYRSYRPGGAKWLRGFVKEKLGDTDYQLQSNDGSIIHRHIDQIRQRSNVSLIETTAPSSSWIIHPGGVGELGTGAGAPVLGAGPTGASVTPPRRPPVTAGGQEPGSGERGRRYPDREHRLPMRYGIDYNID